jgi:hypothetical protein
MQIGPTLLLDADVGPAFIDSLPRSMANARLVECPVALPLIRKGALIFSM